MLNFPCERRLCLRFDNSRRRDLHDKSKIKTKSGSEGFQLKPPETGKFSNAVVGDLLMSAGEYPFPVLQLQGLYSHCKISGAKLMTNYGMENWLTSFIVFFNYYCMQLILGNFYLMRMRAQEQVLAYLLLLILSLLVLVYKRSNDPDVKSGHLCLG